MSNSQVATGQKVPGFKQGLALAVLPILGIMGIVLIAPVLPAMSAHFKDVPYSGLLVPLSLTVPALCLALFSPLTGMLSDLYGRRRLMIPALVTYAIFGTAPLYLDSLYLIFLSRVGVGLSECFLVPIGVALLADYFEEQTRQKWIAYQNVIGSATAAILIMIGGYYAEANWRVPFAAYSLSLVVLLGIIFFTWEPERPKKHEIVQASIPWRHVVHIGILAVVGGTLYYLLPVQIGYVMNARGLSSTFLISIAVGVGALFGAGGAYVSKMLARAPAFLTLALGMFMLGTGIIILSSSEIYSLILLGVIIQQTGGGIMLPTAINFAVAGMPQTLRGRISGTWWFFYFVASFLCPVVIHLMVRLSGDLIVGTRMMGAIGLIACVVLIAIHRATRRASVAARP